MEIKGVCVFLSIFVFLYCAESVIAIPRLSNVVFDEVTAVNSNESKLNSKEQSSTEINHVKESKIPGRIWCQYEDVAEDVSCQEHCLPKGYTYGLCINNACTCA